MSSDLFTSLLSNVWSIFLVIVFFGGSIFVHELGHFLLARLRGVKVARFSIGFGPKIFSWLGRDGVEYRLSWLPLGGYVSLPQLADLRAIEGESPAAETLPPVGYLSKMLVFVAGATFNVIFAFLLACIIWGIGQPTSSETASTRIGYVAAQLDLPDKTKVVSPAAAAGLQIGDVIRRIDGKRINDWSDVEETIVTGTGRTAEDRPKVVFTIERNGVTQDVTLYPRLAGDESFRRVGISPGYELLVHQVAPGSLGEQAGFKPGDEIISLDHRTILNIATYQDTLTKAAGQTIEARVKRDGHLVTLSVPPVTLAKDQPLLGLTLTTGFALAHPSPIAQIWDQARMAFRSVWSLINPHSDIGLSKVAGPVGIVRIFHSAAEAGIRSVLMFTILVNVNLAIFNLLPIPVLDGGQMLFATIARIRGRALPVNFIMGAQSAFIVLLFSMILYVSFFDVRRIVRDARTDHVEAAASSAP